MMNLKSGPRFAGIWLQYYVTPIHFNSSEKGITEEIQQLQLEHTEKQLGGSLNTLCTFCTTFKNQNI